MYNGGVVVIELVIIFVFVMIMSVVLKRIGWIDNNVYFKW